MMMTTTIITSHNKDCPMTNFKKENYDFYDLVKVMAELRKPDGGCPWDLEQNFKTIAPYTIEEAYEVADAIEKKDMENLREELGDLLFQPVYHSQMATELGIFDIHNVIHDVTEKMITRHPHVFGDQNATTAQDVNAIWDERKNAEKRQSNKSAIDNVPLALPALLRAQKLQKKAAKTGFEWTKAEQILDKLEEELGELREACKNKTLADKQDELGDVIFVIANLARLLDVNAEEALRQTNAKFERRFKGLETDLLNRGIALTDATLDQMQDAWNDQKTKERTT